MKISEKKEWAKLLFIREHLSQKEISARVGVSETTISKWVRNENWDRLRQSIIVTKEEQLRRIYLQIDELNSSIFSREEGKRFANSKEADTLSKLTTSAKNLETDASVADIIEVSKRFLNWLKQTDFQKAKEISNLFDAFIKDILK